MAGVAVVIALLAPLVVLVMAYDDGRSVEVVLEPAGSPPEDPFTDSVVNRNVVDTDLEGFSTATEAPEATDPDGIVVSRVRGDRARLYGSSSSGKPCDVDDLSSAITGDEALNRSWAQAAGVDPGDTEEVLRRWTPVVLGRDTAVTNHGYGPGGASPYQSVLQRGTPVLVDEMGVPRTQCSCGNPLLRPEVEGAEVSLVGDRWESFDPAQVDEVRPADQPVSEIETVDVETEEPATIPVGSPEAVELDGLLLADDSGVHVHSESGERLATVVDAPVEEVFDDGAGGLIYNLKRPPAPDGYPASAVSDAPPTEETATVWYLPARQAEPVPLISSDSPATEWAVAQATGTFGGRRVLVYADLALDPSASRDSQLTGRLVLRDLASGDEQVLEEQAYGWELSTRSVTIEGNRIAYENGYEYPSWTVRDQDLAQVPSPCTQEGGTDSGCVWEGGLVDASTLVGVSPSEASESISLQVDDLDSGVHRPLDIPVRANLGGWRGQQGFDTTTIVRSCRSCRERALSLTRLS